MNVFNHPGRVQKGLNRPKRALNKLFYVQMHSFHLDQKDTRHRKTQLLSI